MDILISNSCGSPIYQQIYDQVKNAILSGELREGDMLPSIRALAKDLRISVITTKRARRIHIHSRRQGLFCVAKELRHGIRGALEKN